MIYPVDRSTSSHVAPTTVFQNVSQHLFPYKDSIRYGKEESYTTLYEALKDFFEALWSWVKYTLLFCFFDAEEDHRKELEDEIKEFIDLYYSLAEDPDENKQAIIKKYKKLDKEIQKHIEKKLRHILLEYYPYLDKTQLKNLIKQTISDPFVLLSIKENENNKDKKEDFQPLGVAIFSVRDDLMGFTEQENE